MIAAAVAAGDVIHDHAGREVVVIETTPTKFLGLASGPRAAVRFATRPVNGGPRGVLTIFADVDVAVVE